MAERLLREAVAGETIGSRLLRRWGLPRMLSVPPVRRQLMKTVAGLDHRLPAV